MSRVGANARTSDIDEARRAVKGTGHSHRTESPLCSRRRAQQARRRHRLATAETHSRDVAPPRAMRSNMVAEHATPGTTTERGDAGAWGQLDAGAVCRTEQFADLERAVVVDSSHISAARWASCMPASAPGRSIRFFQ